MAKTPKPEETAADIAQTPTETADVEGVANIETAPVLQESTAVFVTIKNLDVGTRDYPLADGSSIYLPMKHRGAAWPKIHESQISPALRTAERKGHIQIIRN
jgi:hypothetical protein